MAFLDKPEQAKMHSVEMTPTALGLVAGETRDRFRLEALTEIVLRCAGILMVAGSILMWFLLPLDAATGRIASFGATASIMAAAGLVVFAFGTRGFRRQLTLDLERGTLSLTKINIRDQVRVARDIDLGRIDSVFLRRPQQSDGVATLLVRVAGSRAPAIALTGTTEEVERVHRELCQVMQMAKQDKTNARPSLRLDESKPARARLFGS